MDAVGAPARAGAAAPASRARVIRSFTSPDPGGDQRLQAVRRQIGQWTIELLSQQGTRLLGEVDAGLLFGQKAAPVQCMQGSIPGQSNSIIYISGSRWRPASAGGPPADRPVDDRAAVPTGHQAPR